MEIARKRAVKIVSDYSHAGPADDCGGCGENISKGGVRIALPHFQGWMNSEGHHRNMLSSMCQRISVGFYVTNRMSSIVQNFKQPSSRVASP